MNLKNTYKKNIRNVNKNSGGFFDPFEELPFITSFSCDHGGTRRSHVEIKLEKNSNANHIHAH